MKNEDYYQKKISRQYISLVFTLIFVVATLVGGSLYFRFYRSDILRQAEETEYDKYFVMITDNYKSDFWRAVYKGALETAKEQGIYIDLLGENLSGDYSTKELMRIAIASEVDGIIVYASEAPAMANLIDEAVRNGIPVVTLYGDSTHSDRLSFVGVSGYSVGKLYGKQIVDIIKEKRRQDFLETDHIDDRSKIQIAVLASADTLDSGQNIIISSMQDTIRQENATDSEFEVEVVAVDNTNAFSVEESIRDIFMQEEVPDVIVCLNELNTICTYQAVVDFNMVGDVNVLGYYDSEDIVNAIDRGGIYATISIDTLQLGQYSVQALLDYYETGNTSEYFTADTTLIDKSNVDQFKNKEEQDE
nr:substrate-binding domain-containing protein [uncultured Butyrivibrio sp.]